MISRRTFLKAGVAVAGLAKASPLAWARASQPSTAVNFKVPAGACDCHVHIFGDPRRFPFSPGRGYTPELASLDELRAMHRALGLDRVVVVSPSVYGTDNSCMVDALHELGEGARGVAVIDEQTTDASLEALARAGVRGVRLNLTQAGVTDPAVARARFQSAIKRVAPRDWHVQIFSPLSIVAAMSDLVRGSPVPVVFDHFGGAVAAGGLAQPGFDTLLSLVESGRAYVKVSGAADVVSTARPDYPDVAPLARALVAANPERILWATNWPHPDTRKRPGRKATDLAPLLPTDDGRLFNLFAEWVPDAATRAAILVDNPARLYRFDAASGTG
jgi:predicted TIM-barrel fold metal-dependent hydrolase